MEESKTNNIPYGELLGKINLANVNIESGEAEKGINNLQALANDALIIGGPELLNEVNQLLKSGYRKIGDYESYIEVANRIELHRDSVQNGRNKLLISDLQVLYESELLSMQNQLLIEQNKTTRYINTLLVLLLLGIGIILALIYRSFQLQKKEKENYQQLLREKEQALISRNEIMKEKELMHEKLIREESLRAERLANRIKLLKNKFLNEKLSFKEAADEKFWLDFSLKFELLFPEFDKKLLNKYPMLSTSDIQFFKLVKLNLPTNEISALLNVAPTSLYRKKQRIFEKIGIEVNDEKNLADLLPND